MTVRRLRGAGLLAALLALSAPCLAVEPAGGPPEPGLPDTEAEGIRAPAPRVEAPDASVPSSAAPRPWLRMAPQPAAVATVAASPDRPGWRSLAAVAVVVGLGAAALYSRRRRASALPQLPESSTRLRVLSTARIGPKANAVVAEVAGRVILLGVTDTSVSRLFVLGEDEGQAAAPAPTPAPEVRAAARSAPVETADADEPDGIGDIPGVPRGLASRFGEVLDRALGVKPAPREDFRANPGVAALLASGVTDVVGGRDAASAYGRPSPSRPRFEDQAMGLASRRRRA